MKIDLSNPPSDPALLHQVLRDLAAALAERDAAIQERDARIAELEHQLAVLQRHQFGRRSEKVDPRQGLLFGEAPDAPEPPAPVPAPKPKRNGHGRRPLPEHLPRDRVEHDLPADEKHCTTCGTALTQIGEEVSCQLDYVPASFVVREHVRLKYACKACEETILLAPMPDQPIVKGLPGPGLMAHVVVSKYDDHRVQGKLCSRWEKASRGRVTGPGHKPARAATVKSRCGKRRVKRRDVIASGEIREVERK